uniref:Integrase zinc-binding domain-containing protein n=1 Tax=Chromera velia CCMP2878 TaxID=1169474 RepID=A0A0K6S7F9_9ALVE|eukprot:Cvel_20456.t3-p1 / transcript=Cvel_20456.t3 / gene=Cvel_20456 / organism=Chromera_velia_CCMP2878 / gene_product=Transposon Ty3-I Gag-Pol polyprotein, putative / transcript_product=Transposon Ty3-I Gag-Pol polyprotein, putative / location=Cvel_scaffold1836:1818-3746(+) / protein_length=520 / sequence_SO=supercontig / SO=protein_coding / is_pseudo=false
MEKNKLANERVGKWARALQEYAPKFFYKDRKAHADADSLSCVPLLAEHSIDTGAPFCRYCNLPVDGSIPICSSLEASIAGVEVGGVSPLVAAVPFLDKVKAALPSDPFVSLFRYLQEGTLPVETSRRKNVMVQEDSFDIRDGLFYRYEKGGAEQLYVPPALRDTVLTMHHDHPMGGHPAVKRLSQRLLAEFWWPRLRKDAREWVYKCRPCQERRNQPKSRNPQTLPVPSRPFRRVGIDVVGPVPMSRRGNRFMLVITCALTQWPKSILRVTPVPEGARAPPVCYDEYVGFIRQQRIERVDRARGRAEREKQARKHRNSPQMTEKFRLGDRVLLRKPTPNLGKQPKFATKFEEGQTFVVVTVPHDRPHVAVIRPLGGKERNVISTDRLMLWQPAKRVERETEERASAVEKERGEKIPPGTPKSSFRVGEDPDKDDLLDELGLGDELEVEKEEVKESSAGNKKRGKPQPTHILAVQEKEGTEEYRVSFDNGTFAWMPEEEVEAPNLVRDFEKERERVMRQVN